MTTSSEVQALCRVCANPFESCNMIRLVNDQNIPLSIAKAFCRVSELEILADDSRFPQSCCLRCRDRLLEVEDLRSLCLESDQKLRKLIGIGVMEEDEDEKVGIAAIPKVEMHEVSESNSFWDDTENRIDSSEEDIDDKGTNLELVPKAHEEKPSKAVKKYIESKVERKPKTAKTESNKPSPKTKSKVSKEPKSFQCTLCGKIYKTSCGLREHETSHFPDQKNHKCNICSQEFARRKYYLAHLKMHQTENQFKCNECDKAYSADRLLQEHIRVKHRGERPFQCSICPKTFPRASSLYVHIQSVHKKIRKKPFKCDKCTRAFDGKRDYERHLNSHEGIKLNQCPHCGRKYEFKAYLLQHIAEKHSETVENLTRCQYCGLGYSTDGYYRKHIVKRHPEHLEAFDRLMKEKREAIFGGTQSSTTPC